MKINIFMLSLIVSCNLILAQSNDAKFFTGNLKTDFNSFSLIDSFNPNLPLTQSEEKSPLLAGLMSAVIPGSGEIYAERYLKGGIFLLIEAAAWYIDILYNKKGDDQTIFFQNYADENWSVVKYAEWINQYGPNLEHNPNYTFKPITIKPDPTGTMKPWERVNWDELNYAERSISRFSHTLHPYGCLLYTSP
ncbi:MAG: hypothetical protein N3A61_01325, partial [Ignavibacteria bacterium]|nr:hypothetical protein [Ignavibacteria bacterium]